MSNFGFTNTTENAMATAIQPIDLQLKTDYAVVQTGSGFSRLDNKTAPVDLSENITFRYNAIKSVGNSLTNLNPSPIKGGIQYLVKLDALQRTTNEKTGAVVDEPITVQITFRHGLSSNITAETITTLLVRAISSLYKSDGTSRIGDLMRGGVEIDED